MTHYRFVAALRVAEKMAHTMLPAHPILNQYLNLVIRPCGAGWEHHEPVSRSHPDWLWKVTCKSLVTRCGLPNKEQKYKDPGGKIHTKKIWELAGAAHTPGSPLTVNGHAVPIAANYVVFSTFSPIVADHPPVVARHRKGEPHETWESDATSHAIRTLILRNSCRTLRIMNNQAHPHILHRNLDEPELDAIFRRVRELCQRKIEMSPGVQSRDDTLVGG